MSLQAIFVLGVLVAAAVLLVTEWLRADLVALLVLVALGVSGVLTAREALAGFSNSAVISIIGVFILTAALERTGVTQQLGASLVHLGGSTETRMMPVLMLNAALLSLFMNNIAAGAVLMPVAVAVARERKISPSHLMMPLAFGALLGGMATLLTTTNLLANATLRAQDLPGFSLLSFAPIGIPAVFVGTAYMFFIGRRLLPRRAPADWERLLKAGRGQLAEIYGLRERWVQAHVPRGSALVGQTVSQAGLGQALGVNVVAVLRQDKSRLAPSPTTRLDAGDTLFLEARTEQIELLRGRGLEIADTLSSDGAAGVRAELSGENFGLFEIVLSPRSQALGKTLREIQFREKFGLNVVAIWRAGRPRRVGVGEMPLQQGDALLALGPQRRAQMLQSDPDFIVLTTTSEQGLRKSKAPWVVVIMALALGLSAVGIVPVPEAMLGGALAAVLVGALTMDEAYQAIEWRIVFLIAGMLSLGTAMAKTGAAAYIADMLVGTLGAFAPLVVLAVLMLVTTGLTQIMTGQATVAIIAPIALSAAQTMHSNTFTFVMGAALAGSIAFMAPLGHPVNILVMGPGGYKFRDYLRVGGGLAILIFVLCIVLLPLVYGV